MNWYNSLKKNLGQKNKTLVSGNVGEERNLHPGGRKYILINLIKFLKQSLHSKTTLTPLFFVEKQRVLPFIVQREKKHQFFRINLLVENRLNSEFHWPNVFH